MAWGFSESWVIYPRDPEGVSFAGPIVRHSRAPAESIQSATSKESDATRSVQPSAHLAVGLGSLKTCGESAQCDVDKTEAVENRERVDPYEAVVPNRVGKRSVESLGRVESSLMLRTLVLLASVPLEERHEKRSGLGINALCLLGQCDTLL